MRTHNMQLLRQSEEEGAVAEAAEDWGFVCQPTCMKLTHVVAPSHKYAHFALSLRMAMNRRWPDAREKESAGDIQRNWRRFDRGLHNLIVFFFYFFFLQEAAHNSSFALQIAMIR